MQVSIRIKEHLGPSWQQWLEGLQVRQESDGTSRLFGSLQDQPPCMAAHQNQSFKLDAALARNE
jgi:hypothetical protein